MSKTLKELKNKSTFERRTARALISHLREHPNSYARDIGEIMGILGIHYDAVAIKNYHKLHAFFSKHRKIMLQLMDKFIQSGEYEKYIQNGLSENEIFQRYMDFLLSWEVVPLHSDSEDGWKYKLLDLDSWMEMLNSRIRRIGTEFENKIDILRTAHNILPNSTEHVKQELTDTSNEIRKNLLSEHEDE